MKIPHAYNSIRKRDYMVNFSFPLVIIYCEYIKETTGKYNFFLKFGTDGDFFSEIWN